MLSFLCSGLVIYIRQRVKLIHHDIDIVASYTVTLYCYALAFVGSCYGVEFSAANLMLNIVEVRSNGINSGWVTYEDNLVGQEFRFKMKVET